MERQKPIPLTPQGLDLEDLKELRDQDPILVSTNGDKGGLEHPQTTQIPITTKIEGTGQDQSQETDLGLVHIVLGTGVIDQPHIMRLAIALAPKTMVKIAIGAPGAMMDVPLGMRDHPGDLGVPARREAGAAPKARVGTEIQRGTPDQGRDPDIIKILLRTLRTLRLIVQIWILLIYSLNLARQNPRGPEEDLETGLGTTLVVAPMNLPPGITRIISLPQDRLEMIPQEALEGFHFSSNTSDKNPNSQDNTLTRRWNSCRSSDITPPLPHSPPRKLLPCSDRD